MCKKIISIWLMALSILTAAAATNVPDQLYIIGMVGYTGWDTSRGVALTREGNVFRAECVPVSKYGASTTSTFVIVSKLSSSWDEIQKGDRFVASSDGELITSGVPVRMNRRYAGSTSQPDYLWSIAAPEDYDFELDFDTMYMTVTKHVYPETPCTLAATDATASPGGTATVSVAMTTTCPMVGFQWNLKLPEGITVANAVVKNAPNHGVVKNYIASEEVYRFMVISFSNGTIDPANGPFVEITLAVDEDMALDDYDIEFQVPVATNEYLKKVDIEEFKCTLSVTDTLVGVELDRSQLTLQVGETATLTATVTPDTLDDKTVAWSSSNESVATVSAGGVVTAVANGNAVITASCGNGSATCAVTVWSDYKMGDVDGNGEVALADATTTVNYCKDNSSVEVFNADAADMDGNGVVNTDDVAKIVDALLNSGVRSSSAALRVARAEGEMEQFAVDGDAYTLTIRFSNMENYIATMFDLEVGAGMQITYAFYAGGTDHEVKYSKVDDNLYRVVVYSKTNAPFSARGYIYLMFNRVEGDYKVENAVVNRQDLTGNTVDYPALGFASETSGIQAIESAGQSEAEYFDLRGARVANPTTGLYIRRQGDKVEKVIVK